MAEGKAAALSTHLGAKLPAGRREATYEEHVLPSLADLLGASAVARPATAARDGGAAAPAGLLRDRGRAPAARRPDSEDGLDTDIHVSVQRDSFSARKGFIFGKKK